MCVCVSAHRIRMRPPSINQSINHPKQGVAFKKTFSYAGFEQMPKQFTDPKILLLNVELELKSEKDNAEVRIDDPDGYQVGGHMRRGLCRV